MSQRCTCAGRTARRFSNDVYFALAEELLIRGGAELFNRVMPGMNQRLNDLRDQWSEAKPSLPVLNQTPQSSD